MTPSLAVTTPARLRTPVAAPAKPAPAVPVQALVLAEPLPGFPGHRDFVLIPAEATGLLYWLQAVALDGLRFLAVPAEPYFPDYAPALPGLVCAELGLADATDAHLYVLVTVPDGDVGSATANLRAPVVVNPATHRARQVVLADGAYPIREPMSR
jgi:flagellar assembly factor FliW